MSASTSDESTGEAAGAGALSGAAAGSAAGPWGSAIGAVVGAGIGIFGSLEAAQDQADIDTQKQALDEAQANEIAVREAENDQLNLQGAIKAQSQLVSESAASGHGTAPIGSELELMRQTTLQNNINDQDAAFQESQIQAGASMQGELAQNTLSSGNWNAAASAAKTAGSLGGIAYGVFGGSNQNLPQAPSWGGTTSSLANNPATTASLVNSGGYLS